MISCVFFFVRNFFFIFRSFIFYQFRSWGGLCYASFRLCLIYLALGGIVSMLV